jgi:O-antigen/teichoic acid export membrane protein
MNEKRRQALNVASSVAQAVISTAIVLVLYRYLLGKIGIERLGIWSLVLAVGSAVQIANVGMPGTITKFIAEYRARQDLLRVSVILQTATISIALLSAVLIFAGYFVGKEYLKFAISGALQDEALEVLPLTLAAFWVSMLGGAYQSVLFGYQRIVERNAILIFDSVAQFALGVLLVSHIGLRGLVWARLLTNILTLSLLMGVVRHYVSGVPIIPRVWSRTCFREMMGYALSLQFVSLLVLFAVPVTKGLLGRFGSLSMVGYYEMADRVIQAFRSLLVSANQVAVPMFARARIESPGKEAQLFQGAYDLNALFAISGFAVLIAATPIISLVWVGEVAPLFVMAVTIVGVGWMINVLAVPIYMACLGAGAMRMIVTCHIAQTVINLGLGWILGRSFGAIGVIAAWAAALAVSAVMLVANYIELRNLPWASLFPAKLRWLACISVAGICSAVGMYVIIPGCVDGKWVMGGDLVDASGVITVATGSLLLVAFCFSESRREIATWLTRLKEK